MVFLLAIAGACGLGALYGGFLPKEDAGRAIIEILNNPSKDAMKAHAQRIRSGAVLEKVIKNLNAAQSSKGREEVRDSLQQNLDVTVSGPFLTITVYEKNQSPAEFANGVAQAYDEDLKMEEEINAKRESQNLQGQITVNESSAGKARLEWLDIMRKHDLRPDAGSIVNDAITREIATRLAKDSAELVELENRILVTDPTDPLLADKKAAAEALRAQIKSWQKAAKEQDMELLSRTQRRSDMDEAKYRYDSQGSLVHKLREESMDRNISEGVVKRPTRLIEEARTVDVPDRRLVKLVGLGTAGCAVLLAALLLTALATRLCRRA